MPLVLVTHNPSLTDERLQRIKPLLKEVVATELDCSETEPDGEGGLKPDDISVRFQPYGPNDDQEECDLDVLVIAEWYQSRADNVQKRTERIMGRLCSSSSSYPASSIGVFVTLPDAGWSLGYPGD